MYVDNFEIIDGLIAVKIVLNIHVCFYVLYNQQKIHIKNLGGNSDDYPVYDLQKVWVTPHQRVPFSPCKTTIRGIEAVLEEFQHPRLPNFNFPIPPKVSIQIASNKWYKGENIFYLDQNQIDELKNSKENKSGVRLEITPKQIKKKEGGFLPLILSCLEAAAVATPDIVALYDSYRDSKHKKKIKEKTIRHNKEMEKK